MDMIQDTHEIEEFTNQFIENYTIDVIEEDVVTFFNDAFIMLQNFYNLKENSALIQSNYANFIDHVIKHSDIIAEYTDFDFKTLSSVSRLHNATNFSALRPIYTNYSFSETEETVNQILEELKVVKEFQKELKDEINYLVEEYQFHLDHLRENMMYNFYVYNEIVEEHLDDDFLEEFKVERMKFIQRITYKIGKK